MSLHLMRHGDAENARICLDESAAQPPSGSQIWVLCVRFRSPAAVSAPLIAGGDRAIRGIALPVRALW